MSDVKKDIISRNTKEVEPGVKKLDLVNCLLELEARIKNCYSVIDEIKEVLQGQAKWSQETDERLQRLDPKIILPGDEDFNNTIGRL